MPQVTVTIAGRVYRMACGENEEAHLEGLAADLDQRITDLRKGFGEIGDMRLHVMAALSVADELYEARKEAQHNATLLSKLQQERLIEQEAFELHEAACAQKMTNLTERINALVAKLSDKTTTVEG